MQRVWQFLKKCWENYVSPMLIRVMVIGILYLACEAVASHWKQQPVQLVWRHTLLVIFAVTALTSYCDWQEKHHHKDEA